jgi:hypothetical protein
LINPEEASMGLAVPYRKKAWLKSLFGDAGEPRIRFDGARIIPHKYCYMLLAMVEFGKFKVPDFMGEEHSARNVVLPPDPPWKWAGTCIRDDRFLIFDDTDQKQFVESHDAEAWWSDILPTMQLEQADELAARQRWKSCLADFHRHLVDGKIEAFVLEDSGNLHPISTKRWMSVEGADMLHTQRANFVTAHGYNSWRVKGQIVVESSVMEPESSALDAISQLADEAIDPNKFPYLAFMLKAAKLGPCNPSDHTPKKVIEGWLSDNWPPELGEPTPNKIRSMASFLRRPEDERGGLKGKGSDH